MATDGINLSERDAIRPGPGTRSVESRSAIRLILAPFASLKLTVVLFALSIFLVFAGTLALVDHGIWHVVGRIFRTWIAWIEFQSFFPRNMSVSGGFWFPGGWWLGGLLTVNLLAAHAYRFKVRARGARLVAGIVLIAAGALATAAVIYSGTDSDFEGELSPEFCDNLWTFLKAALVVLWGGASAWLLAFRGERHAAWWILIFFTQLIGALAIWLLADPSARLNPSNLRILWQLTKSSAAAVVLLIGCRIVFQKRGGIVVLHSGVALMMLGELITGLWADEGTMQILEGQTINYVQDIRSAELAVIDTSDDNKDRVTVIPQTMLARHSGAGADSGVAIDDDRLPFNILVQRLYMNSELVSHDTIGGENPLGDRGLARLWAAKERPVVAGSSSDDGVDEPAAYVELVDKTSGEPIGTYLLNVKLQEQPVRVGVKQYAIALRFKRTYKPYSMKLLDFHFDKYVGTETPKNFSSDLQLVDSGRDVEREVTVWMNNPLRYAGETFYQQSYTIDPRTGEEVGTTLQVVSNKGWMIPYASCMIVAIGMLAHFAGKLVRFLNRRHVVTEIDGSEGFWPIVLPTLLIVLGVVYLGSKLRTKTPLPGEMRLDEAGRIPVAFEGRVKPLDTVARASMRFVSKRDYYEIETANSSGEKETEKRPAIEWLLDVISGSPAAREHKVIRIENLQVLAALGLEPRSGFRYAIDEFLDPNDTQKRERFEAFETQAASLSEKEFKHLDPNEKKYIETSRRLSHLRMLRASFHQVDRSTLKNESDIRRLLAAIDRLERHGVHAIPPRQKGSDWELLTLAEIMAMAEDKPNDAVSKLRAILDAYAAGDASKFNLAVKAWRETLEVLGKKPADDEKKPADADSKPGGVAFAELLDLDRIDFETSFNRFAPFSIARVFYVAAFVLSCLSWIGWSPTLNRSAFYLLILTWLLHLSGIAAYIYISGRPAVTNLYSSAVVVGFGCVMLAISFEAIHGRGLGNLVASVAGFVTLLVSHFLGLDGDTIKVMQAVLDTNFWLALHVTCIVFGYSTTFLTGLFGLLFVILGLFPNTLDKPTRDLLARIIYGTLCFATFFSFVGTVFGGLWADDSWGRFWGWDPKENGALIIVLWNVLVLHSRWGKMVGPRGLAILAIGGNIVTAWSWFGVNALEVGLHSYGFDSSTVRWLVIFVGSQVAAIVLGLLTAGRDSQLPSSNSGAGTRSSTPFADN